MSLAFFVFVCVDKESALGPNYGSRLFRSIEIAIIVTTVAGYYLMTHNKMRFGIAALSLTVLWIYLRIVNSVV